jgi:hypothetical protein
LGGLFSCFLAVAGHGDLSAEKTERGNRARKCPVSFLLKVLENVARAGGGGRGRARARGHAPRVFLLL